MAAHCHCLDCRKATGSAFATVVAVPAEAVTVENGQTRSWTVTGMSGEVTRESPDGVVRRCLAFTGSPGIAFIKAGAFDDADWITPEISCWTSRQLPWARLPPELPGAHQP